MTVLEQDTPWMTLRCRHFGLWLGCFGCLALMPFRALAAENNDFTKSEAGKQASHVASGTVLPPQIQGVLSNWPAVNIETGFLQRAVMPPKHKLDYKWANIIVGSQDKTNSVAVPDGFALPAPRAPRGMILISGGMFVMGFGAMPPGNEAVARKISSYYIDAFEVPGGVWAEICQWASTHGYTNLAKGQNGTTLDGGDAVVADHPVVNVSWYDCVKWCNARSEKERLLPVYYLNGAQKQVYRNGIQDLSNICVDWTANGYRLPTEAEWEKAARGGISGMLYPFGDNLDKQFANYSSDHGSNYNGTTTIGYFRARVVEIHGKKETVSDENGYGLHDMAGNVYEWCWDWFGPYTTNVYGPDSGVYRVMRGGCWASVETVNLSCGYRNAMRPGIASPYVGFRCVRKH